MNEETILTEFLFLIISQLSLRRCLQSVVQSHFRAVKVTVDGWTASPRR